MNEKQEQADRYDRMINWEVRLAREMPVIENFLDRGTVLDVACSSGRHSFALEDLGFEVTGIDISEEFIEIAERLKAEHSSAARFLVVDATSPELVETFLGSYFDNVVMLGNAIANMPSLEQGKKLIRNLFLLTRPGGKFFAQTIHRPSKPYFSPLREVDGNILQRIMVPIVPGEDETHNVELHVNLIDPKTNEYVSLGGGSPFYMYTRQEFRKLLENTGWMVQGVYKGYEKAEPQEEDSETLIWEVQKPEIEIYPETEELFAFYGIPKDQIVARVLPIWQKLLLEHWYHCLRDYRFLYPRIHSHPRYRQVLEAKYQTPVLDLACNTGTDLRAMQMEIHRIVENAPDTEYRGSLVGIDQSQVFIDLGFAIFDDKEECTIEFHVFDLLNEKILNIDSKGTLDGKFARFEGNFGAIHAGSLLHLLTQAQQTKMSRYVFALLQQHGIFFGRMVGKAIPELSSTGLRYIQSPESLQEMLGEIGFVDVEVQIMPKEGPMREKSSANHYQMMFYAVKP